MSIRRKGNRWEVRVRIGSGRRFERTLPPTATRADARSLEAQVRRETVNASIGRPQTRLIDQALDQWIATGADKLKSWERDLRFRFAVIREYTAKKPLDEIVNVSEQIKKDGQKEGLNPATINRYVSILRRVGNLAERWGWTDLPLGRRVRLLPEHSERHTYLTPAMADKLCKKADPETRDMIVFALLTGLRLGEMYRIRPDQVADGLMVLGSDTKSGRPRGVPLPPEAVRIAEQRLPWTLSRPQLRRRFLEARKAAGMENVRWHDLRHTYASWIVQAGQPLTAVRDLLGHSSLAVTNRYAHLSPGHLVDAVASLPKMGEGWGKRKTVKSAVKRLTA